MKPEDYENPDFHREILHIYIKPTIDSLYEVLDTKEREEIKLHREKYCDKCMNILKGNGRITEYRIHKNEISYRKVRSRIRDSVYVKKYGLSNIDFSESDEKYWNENYWKIEKDVSNEDFSTEYVFKKYGQTKELFGKVVFRLMKNQKGRDYMKLLARRLYELKKME